MAKTADIPGSIEIVTEYAKELFGMWHITGDPHEFSKTFFDHYDKTDWWTDSGPVGDWKAMCRGWAKRKSEEQKGNKQSTFKPRRFSVCNICWYPHEEHPEIEGLPTCNCVTRCVKDSRRLNFYMKSGVSPSKLMKAIWDGKPEVQNILTPEEVDLIEVYYKCSRIIYVSVFDRKPDARTIMEHIYHYKTKFMNTYADWYDKKTKPFFTQLAQMEGVSNDGTKEENGATA